MSFLNYTTILPLYRFLIDLLPMVNTVILDTLYTDSKGCYKCCYGCLPQTLALRPIRFMLIGMWMGLTHKIYKSLTLIMGVLQIKNK